MTIISYHSTLFSHIASHLGATDTTSSQILLSRAIADSTPSPPIRPRLNQSPVPVASIYESPSRHIMTLNAAAKISKDVGLDGEPSYNNDSKSNAESQNFDDPDSCAPDSKSESNLITPTNPPGVSASFSFNPWDLPELSITGKGKEVERGRTLERTPRHPNPFERAESRPQRNNLAIELDARHIRTRTRSSTLHNDPNDPCAVLDDEILEPFVETQADSVSEVLSGTNSSRASMASLFDSASLQSALQAGQAGRMGSWNCRSSRGGIASIEPPSRALTTVFSECPAVSPEPVLPVESLSQFRPNIDHLEDVASRSNSLFSENGLHPSCQTGIRNTHYAFTFSKLPTEINQQIYRYLRPVDFNSARHTCRTWYINSLERSLLETMIKRGGWLSSCQQEISDAGNVDSRKSANYQWLMSRRISRECALGPDWTGSGISSKKRRGSIYEKKSVFTQASIVDFTEVAVHSSDSTPAGITFTVSSCGKFLMVANGCLIYIYELNKNQHNVDDWSKVHAGSLRPVTSVICPHRVLACSMDTSSHRYAIAVLLDGRMGLVVDISLNNIIPPNLEPEGSGFAESLGHSGGSDLKLAPGNDFHHSVSFLDRVSLDSSAPVHSAGRSAAAFVFPGIAATRSGGSCPETGKQQNYDEELGEATTGQSSYPPSVPSDHFQGSRSRSKGKGPAPRESNANIKAIPVESGPRSLYRNLCSEDDPPRSVAICPQRRCVAFGCSAGIELHWVDALTGQDLNRWFPLTAPSDFLFFLPPRKSVDSAKKLRLISSAAKPCERAAVHERAFGRRARNGAFWERLGWSGSQGDNLDEIGHAQEMLGRYRSDGGNLLGSTIRRTDHSDHYRAVPLSDGYHILFTDPGTGALCMGSDAPVGGPTKLLRKVWFQGPEGIGSPAVYAGGSDLKWGVRVVAAFGSGTEQSIWLFSVPGDVFQANQTSQALLESSVWQRRGSIKEPKNMHWLEWWPDNGLQEWLHLVQNPVPGVLPGNMWPIMIKGQKIGSCPGVVDLAIDSSQGVTIWAFSKSGVANVWRVDGGNDCVAKLSVMRDGTIRENDFDDEISMSEYSLTPEILQHPSCSPPEQQSFDGTFSPDSSTIITTRRGSCSSPMSWSYHSVNYDSEGDVIMEDLNSDDAENSWTETTYEAHPSSVQDQQFQYLTARWSRSGHRRHMDWNTISVDLVEEMRGVARIEIEIR